MTSTFVNDLRLAEMATGDNSGSWGTVTNTNLELIGEALGYGTEGITTNANTHTSTIADGATDPVRALYVEYTGTLDSACTITIAPNTVNKVCFIENGTSGSQNIIIKQGSGATITIPAGQTKAVYLDGAGSGAKVVDAFASLSVVDLIVSDDLVVGDDLGVTGLVTIGETLAVTGVLTTTAATVFNGGFVANDGSTITTADNTTQLTLESTDTDANSGPLLELSRNVTGANNDFLGQVIFKGKDTAGNSHVFGRISNQIKTATSGSETSRMVLTSTVGASEVSRIDILPTETVINDDSADLDFRVESNGNASMLFVDGGNNGVSIGTATVDGGVLTVQTGNTHPTAATFQSTGTTQLFLKDTDAASNNKYWGFQVSGGSLNIITCDDNKAGGFVTPLELTQTDVKLGTGADFITNTAGTSNVRIGVNAGISIESGGNFNVCIGDEAGTVLSTGDENVFVGYNAGLANTTGGSNVAIGRAALVANVGGTRNTAIGDASLASASGSDNNVAVGRATGLNCTGGNNTFIGTDAGEMTTSADNSVFIGAFAGQGITGTKLTGNNNIAIGKDAGTLLQGTATNNLLIGEGAGAAMTVGEQNVCIGGDAGDAIVTTDANTLVGYNAGGLTTGTFNAFYGRSSGSAMLAGTKNSIIGSNNGNQEIDLRALHNRIVLSDGDGNIGLYVDNASQAFFGDMDLDTDGAAINANAIGTEMAGNFYQDNNSDVVLVKMRHAFATGSQKATMIQFQQDNGNEDGSIKTSGSATEYNTSSDYRLKENVDYSWDATTRLKKLKPVRFNFILDETNTLVDGFLAHEAAEAVPAAVDGVKDATHVVANVVLSASDEVISQGITEESWTKRKADILYKENDIIPDGKSVGDVRRVAKFPSDSTWVATRTLPKHQQIDHSKIVPLLAKTILELEARITALEG